MKGSGTLNANLIKIVLLLVAALLITAVCTFTFNLFHPTSSWYLGFLAVGLVTTWALVGFRPRRDIFGGQATQIVVVYLLFYLILIYLLGLVTGFLRNGYSLALPMILRNTLPVISATLLTELWRYALVKRIGEHRLALASIVLAFSGITIMVGAPLYNLNNSLEIFEMIGQLVLGGLAANVMLTFVAYKSDLRPTMTYALIMAVYPIVIPILPDLGPFIYSVLAIMLPMLLFIRFNEFFTTRRPIPGRHKPSGRLITTIPTVAGLVIVVILISGIFRYWAVAIGSNSMQPTINTGDVTIIDKNFGNIKQVELGSIIAFWHDGQVITHRLVELKNSASGLLIQTKGDNNSGNDMWTIREPDLIGVVRYRIPLIGWPTIWLDRTF